MNGPLFNTLPEMLSYLNFDRRITDAIFGSGRTGTSQVARVNVVHLSQYVDAKVVKASRR